MRTKDKPNDQHHPTFTEAARRAQIIECAIETIATLGYAQASLAQIAKQTGISKGVITYYFTSKEELLEQVVTEIYTAAVQAVTPQIAAQPTAQLRLQAYDQCNAEFRKQERYCKEQREVLRALEDLEEHLLRQGQEEGEFRAFDLRVMAVTIRRAIDAVAPLLAAHPTLDTDLYAQELVTLFDRATRKE